MRTFKRKRQIKSRKRNLRKLIRISGGNYLYDLYKKTRSAFRSKPKVEEFRNRKYEIGLPTNVTHDTLLNLPENEATRLGIKSTLKLERHEQEANKKRQQQIEAAEKNKNTFTKTYF